MKNREETIEQAGAAIRAERERQEQDGRQVLKKLCALQRQLEASGAASLEALGQDDKAYDKAEDAQVRLEVRRRNLQVKLRELASPKPHEWTLREQEARAQAERQYKAELETEIERLGDAMREESDPSTFGMLKGKQEALQQEMDKVLTLREVDRLKSLASRSFTRVSMPLRDFEALLEAPEQAEEYWCGVLLTLYGDQVRQALETARDTLASWRNPSVTLITGRFLRGEMTVDRDLAITAHTRDEYGREKWFFILEVDGQGRVV